MAERCHLHRIPVERLEDGVKDPALASLVDDGWEVMGSVVVDSGDGRGPFLNLILRPPRSREVTGKRWERVPSWVWVITGVIIGTGLTMTWTIL